MGELPDTDTQRLPYIHDRRASTDLGHMGGFALDSTPGTVYRPARRQGEERRRPEEEQGRINRPSLFCGTLTNETCPRPAETTARPE